MVVRGCVRCGATVEPQVVREGSSSNSSDLSLSRHSVENQSPPQAYDSTAYSKVVVVVVMTVKSSDRVLCSRRGTNF